MIQSIIGTLWLLAGIVLISIPVVLLILLLFNKKFDMEVDAFVCVFLLGLILGAGSIGIGVTKFMPNTYYSTDYDLEGVYAEYEKNPDYTCVLIEKPRDDYYTFSTSNSIQSKNKYRDKISVITFYGKNTVKYTKFTPSEKAKMQYEAWYDTTEKYRLDAQKGM